MATSDVVTIIANCQKAIEVDSWDAGKEKNRKKLKNKCVPPMHSPSPRRPFPFHRPPLNKKQLLRKKVLSKI